MALTPAPLSSGRPVRALDFPQSWFVRDRTTLANLTNTSYASGDPEIAARIMAPTSGRLAVSVGGAIRNNSATADRLWIAFDVFEGDPTAGTQVFVEEVKYGISNHAISDASDDYQYLGNTTIVQGLTPGTFYYVRHRYKTTNGNGTADIAFRSLFVFPVP